MAKKKRQKRKRTPIGSKESAEVLAEGAAKSLHEVIRVLLGHHGSSAKGHVPASLAIIDWGLQAVSEEPAPSSTRSFKTLLFFAALATDRSQRETLLGCIQERFEKEYKLFGERRAYYLMIRDIIKGCGSGLGASVGKIVRTVLKYIGLGGLVRYFFG